MSLDRFLSSDATGVRSTSIEGFARTNSTELQNKTNTVALKSLNYFSHLTVKGLAKLGLRYIELKTGNQESVYVKIHQVARELGWSKQEVKKAFTGENGLEKLQEAFALKDLSESPQGVETDPSKESLRQSGSTDTESTSSSIEGEGEDITARGASATDKPTMADVIALSKVKDIHLVAQKALEALKHTSKSAAIGYENSKQESAHIFIIDPKNLTIQTGATLGIGTSGHVFNVEGTAVKINTLESVLNITQNNFSEDTVEDLGEEIAFLEKLGEHEGIIKTKGKEEIHEISYLSEPSYDAMGLPPTIGRLNITKSYIYDGDMRTFIGKHANDGDYKVKVLAMQKQIMEGYSYIHSKGCFHLDGKPDNFYYKIQGKEVEGALGDFGRSIEIKTDGETKVPTYYESTKGYELPSLGLKYKEQAKIVNALIDQGAPKEQIIKAQEDCRKTLEQADNFQKAVALYQMAVGDAEEKFPYSRSSFGIPVALELDRVKQELDSFYGEGHPIATHILNTLSQSLP